MAMFPTHEEKAAHEAQKPADTHADKGVPKPGPGIVAPRPDLLLALLATDWIIGDKHHYAAIRGQVLRLLENLGEDGKEAKARIEGMSGAQPPVVAPMPAKAA
jgi:hypothetical protein